jgi:biopolymer transport protein ExbD
LTQLESRLASESQQQPQPSIRLSADKDARYETVAQVLALASQAQMDKIAFVSQ